MDNENWLKGYETGVMLHGHVRIPQRAPSVIASMSVTGGAAFDWFVDLSRVWALTRLTAQYAGNVTVSHSYDGTQYTEPVPIAEFLRVNPALLLRGANHNAPRLWFRFQLTDEAANLTAFSLWGFPEG